MTSYGRPTALSCVAAALAAALPACSSSSSKTTATTPPGDGGSSVSAEGGSSSTGIIGSLTITTIGSTVDPMNGDQNPYGLAIAPDTMGLLTAGDLVICNFNDSANVQGNGTTIEILNPAPGSTPTRMVQDRTSRAAPPWRSQTTTLRGRPRTPPTWRHFTAPPALS